MNFKNKFILTDARIVEIGISVFGAPEPSCLSGNGVNDQLICAGEYPIGDQIIMVARAVEVDICGDSPALDPIAWSITYQGDHVGNIFHHREVAQAQLDSLMSKFPNEARKLVPLYDITQPTSTEVNK